MALFLRFLLVLLLAGCAGRHTVDGSTLGGEASRSIDFDSPDYDAMATAIEQLTNSVRLQHKLAPLETNRRLRSAAAGYARKMVEEGFLAHEDPNTPALRTPEQRVAAAGGSNPRVAENIADIPAFRVESGEPFYVLDSDTPVIARDPEGPPIDRHTYGSLAATVVEGWMNSAGHRRNLLDENTLEIGVGAQMHLQQGIPAFIIVQNFQLYEALR